MSSQNNVFTEDELELMEEMESYITEVKKHPEITGTPLSENLHRELWRDIREYNEEKTKAASVVSEPVLKESEPEASRLSEEEKELIQLGKIYKRKKKNKKFYVLIAAVVGAMTLGITSMGGPEKVFERFARLVPGREQTRVNSDSDDIKLVESISEEEAYQQIEDEYGVWPVQLGYLPDGVEFIRSTNLNETQILQLHYGRDDKICISYHIRPGYRDGSWGIDVEDGMQEEYVEVVNDVEILVKKFQVEGMKSYRWTAEYSYQDLQYYLEINYLTESEFAEIINNLKFL